MTIIATLLITAGMIVLGVAVGFKIAPSYSEWERETAIRKMKETLCFAVFYATTGAMIATGFIFDAVSSIVGLVGGGTSQPLDVPPLLVAVATGATAALAAFIVALIAGTVTFSVATLPYEDELVLS